MKRLNRVIAFGPPKEAALYFEEVLPLDFSFAWFPALGFRSDLHEEGMIADAEYLGIPFDGTHFDQAIVKSLMPGADDPVELYANQFLLMSAYPLTLLMAIVFPKESLADLRASKQIETLRAMFEFSGVDLDQTFDEIESGNFNFSSFSSRIVPRIKWFVEKSGFIGASSWLTRSAGEAELLGGQRGNAGYALAIRDLDLVDARRISWESILEFRKDKDSMSALRRFRAFFADSFAGKDGLYVSDRLATLLEDYERTTKLWGFETARKTFSVAVSTQNVANTSIGTLAPLLAGMPLPLAAGVGAAITVGNCALEFSKVFVDQREAYLNNPLNYLTRLKDLTK